MTTLVLLHAFPLDSRMYDSIRDQVNATLVTPDLSGFGATELSNDEPSLERYVDDVLQRLDWQGIDDFVLGGTSMGGYVSLALARRSPQRVQGLVLIDSKASADTDEAAQGRRDLADRMEAEHSVAALVEGLFPRLLGETTKANNDELVTMVRAEVEAVTPAAAAWAQRAMANRDDAFDVLRALKVPVLAIVGEEDVITPRAESEQIVEAAADGRLVVIDGAAHLTPLEAASPVTSALNDFLESL